MKPFSILVALISHLLWRRYYVWLKALQVTLLYFTFYMKRLEIIERTKKILLLIYAAYHSPPAHLITLELQKLIFNTLQERIDIYSTCITIFFWNKSDPLVEKS